MQQTKANNNLQKQTHNVCLDAVTASYRVHMGMCQYKCKWEMCVHTSEVKDQEQFLHAKQQLVSSMMFGGSLVHQEFRVKKEQSVGREWTCLKSHGLKYDPHANEVLDSVYPS